jgi:hypothetical protein
MRGTIGSQSVTQSETHNGNQKLVLHRTRVKAPAALYGVMPLKPRGKFITAEFFPLLMLVASSPPSHGRLLVPVLGALSAELRMLLRAKGPMLALS